MAVEKVFAGLSSRYIEVRERSVVEAVRNIPSEEFFDPELLGVREIDDKGSVRGAPWVRDAEPIYKLYRALSPMLRSP